MHAMVSHSIRVATLGFILAALALSAHAQETMSNEAVIGGKDTSEDNNDKIDFGNAKALPLPSAPDSVAVQAEKDLIENLVNRNRSCISAPAGQEAGSEGDGMTNSVEPGIPSAIPNTKDLKSPR